MLTPTENVPKGELLTEKEREIIELIGKGFRNEEIADALNLDRSEIENHLTCIFGKLGVFDRLNLVIRAYQSGLIN